MRSRGGMNYHRLLEFEMDHKLLVAAAAVEVVVVGVGSNHKRSNP